MNTQPNLFNSLGILGKDEKWRAKIIAMCKEIEHDLKLPNLSVRDEITGPIIDALHRDAGVLKKVLKSGIVFEFKYRSKIARDFVMSPEINPDHAWEPQTTKLLLYLADNAKQVIVGGAYFGDQTVLIAKKLAENNGICHAFEPNKEQFAMLERNVKSNGLNSNALLNCIGLWENDRTILKLVGEDSFAHSEVVHQKPLQSDDTFKTISINTYGKLHNIESFDLIMLDLEGAELSTLKGAEQYLKQPLGVAPNIVFEIHRNYADWSDGLENTEHVKFLSKFGYHVFAVRDFQSNFPTKDMPIELIPADRVYLEGPAHGFNMLAVKDAKIIENANFLICNDVSPKLLLHKESSLFHPTKIL